MTCSSCGAIVVQGSRFCAQCGSPVLSAAGEGERRKSVTVMFTDLVESTSMAERLDPEALADVLGRYFAVARSVVEGHGGTVEKFIGDAVVAMFGVERVREDDALRAVRTGLELREAVDRLNDDLDAAYGARLRIRTGINTGEVLVNPGQTDNLAVGHAVSMAARLEQAAGPDQVVVGEPTFRLLGPGVLATPIDPLAVKGSSVPLLAWRIDGLVAAAAPGWHTAGAYVGRAAELEAVTAAYARVVADARSAAVLVVAPPGLGKSRFAAEVGARLQHQPRILVGRGVADGGSTYGPLVEILREVGAGEESGRFEAALGTLPDAPQVARSARALVAGTGIASTGEVAWVVRRVATGLASEAPLLLVVDDLHWTDPLLLDVVAELVEPPIPGPILLLALTRPELLEEQPDWLQRLANVSIVRLQPLTAEDTRLLIGDRLGADVDAAHRERVLQAAAGVPLFVEQLAALDAESPAGAVPSGMRALMAARIDRITGDARTVVETAAIAGEAFAAGDAWEGANVEAALDSLVRREILRRDAAGGYRFEHALLRDAVIDALPKRRRAELHERRAAKLEAAKDVDLEGVGFHLESAWRERTSIALPDAAARALGVRAAEALATAGRRSLARKEWHRAVDLLGRAERLVAGEPDRADILPDLIDALVNARELEAADRLHDEAMRIARDPIDRARADTAWVRIYLARRQENWPEIMSGIANASIAIFEAGGDETWLARALIVRFMGVPSGESDLETLKAARVHAERAGDERALIEVWDELGGAMLNGPTPYSEALEFMRAEAAWARERGVAFTEADGMLGEAYALAGLGEVETARTRLESVRGLFEALPSVVEQLGETWVLEGLVMGEAGDFVAAADAYGRAVTVFEACGEAGWARNARSWLAHAELDRGQTAAAAALLDHVRPGPTTPNWFRAFVGAGDARVALQEGDTDRARELALAASMLIDARSPYQAAIPVLERLGDVFATTGDSDAARLQYEGARARAIAKEDRVAEPRLRAKIDATMSGR